MIVKDDAVGDLEWVVSMDSSVVRAHQHSAGARKRGCSDDVEAIVVGRGRTRPVPWRAGTKIHLAVNGRGLPMRFLLTAGQAGDNPQLIPLLDGISVARLDRAAMRARQIRFVGPSARTRSPAAQPGAPAAGVYQTSHLPPGRTHHRRDRSLAPMTYRTAG
ncbi:transposase [Amycolatopsis saalfeldensis]|uniref:transposase n=1 Tax=Amycolatopsis saalfeldensis TaxID=394193 RepID=UPI000B8674DF